MLLLLLLRFDLLLWLLLLRGTTEVKIELIVILLRSIFTLLFSLGLGLGLTTVYIGREFVKAMVEACREVVGVVLHVFFLGWFLLLNVHALNSASFLIPFVFPLQFLISLYLSLHLSWVQPCQHIHVHLHYLSIRNH